MSLTPTPFLATPGKTTFSRVPGDVGTSSYLARRVTEGLPYLGLGLGAQTFTDTTIAYNDGAAAKSLPPYLRSVEAGRLPIQDLYDLPAVQMMGKMCSVEESASGGWSCGAFSASVVRGLPSLGSAPSVSIGESGDGLLGHGGHPLELRGGDLPECEPLRRRDPRNFVSSQGDRGASPDGVTSSTYSRETGGG